MKVSGRTKQINWDRVINTGMPDKGMRVQYTARSPKAGATKSKSSAWRV